MTLGEAGVEETPVVGPVVFGRPRWRKDHFETLVYAENSSSIWATQVEVGHSRGHYSSIWATPVEAGHFRVFGTLVTGHSGSIWVAVVKIILGH